MITMGTTQQGGIQYSNGGIENSNVITTGN